MIPREPRLPSAVGARWHLGQIIHLSLPCLRKLTSVSSRGLDRARLFWGRDFRSPLRSVFPTIVTGGFLVLVVAQGQQPPSIRAGSWPYAPCRMRRWTLSGSRNGKRTHLFFGEQNACPEPLRYAPPVPILEFRGGRGSPPLSIAACSRVAAFVCGRLV